MTNYLVSWTINLQADSAEDAARKALKIQRDPNSIATIFDVQEILHGDDLGEERTFDIDESMLGDSSVEH